MEIHELNTKAITDPAYIAADDGTDTYKMDLKNLLTQAETAATNYTDAALVSAKNYSDGKLASAVTDLEAEIGAATTIPFYETNSNADSALKTFKGEPTLTTGQFLAVKFNNGNTSDSLYFNTRMAHSTGGYRAYFMGSTDAPTFDANTVLFFYFAPTPEGEYVPRYYYLGYWSTSGGGGGGGAEPYTSNPEALGTASPGTSAKYSRGDHVHPKPSAADLGVIAAPSTASSGDFLTYNGSAWVATSLSTWSGGNY